MEAHILEWLSLLVRWLHVITGVAWIGASFYFNFLENNLEREGEKKEGILGDLWAIHGGGFYFLEKYKVAPKIFPTHLHWFKWEAYMTWVSGISLMVLVYYMNADVYMIDPKVSDISSMTAIVIGITSLIVVWVVYDLLCKTPLVEKPFIFGLITLSLATLTSYGLCQYLNPRAAYMHVGAMVGTIMVANVFFVIIPSQKSLVTAMKESGKKLDPKLGLQALRRSRHNNYMTLPVLFIMFSNHYPSTFGHQFNWAVLAVISIAGALIRHFFNVRHLPKYNKLILPTGVLLLVGLIFATAPTTKQEETTTQPKVSFTLVSGIIANRCLSCHSASPTDDVIKVAPNGLTFDTPNEIKSKIALIKLRTITTQTMPLANKTGMTDKERKLLATWIEQGALIQ